MVKIVASLFTFLLLTLISTPLTLAASEEITSFNATYQINQDGTVSVTEDITYNAGGNPHHGIIRNVNLVKTNQENQKFEVAASNITVNAPYQNQSTSRELILKIGDANTTFSGTKTYTIKYTLSGALTYFTDHDELYWNVTGNEWTLPIATTSVNVKVPGTINNSNLNLTCYTGPVGSREQDCRYAVSPIQNSTASFKADNLNPSKGLTIVLGFPKDMVAKLEPKKTSDGLSGIKAILAALGFVGFYILLPFLVVILWLLFGRDPKVTPGPRSWFDPPKHQDGKALLPAEVGLLTDEKVDPRDISATLVSLAIRGFLKIKKEEDGNYTFQKSNPKDSHDKLSDFEEDLYEGLFKNQDTATTKELQKRTHFSTKVSQAKSALYQKLTKEGYFTKNPETVRNTYAGIGVASMIVLNFLLGITLIIISRFMPKKTKLGAEKKEEALSLKRFLSTQERQLTFQEQNWYFFEKLLPYAVAFGVTTVWASRFKDLTIPEEVDWYQGDTKFLNAYLLANSLGSFTRVAEVATRTPYSSTRSYSGFSSGFGGGGFSGGGGGGGGGSSW